MNITRLFYLAYTKNAVNRKRRRFYAYWHTGYSGPLIKPTKSISKEYAAKMYEAAKTENKSYTSEFRSLRLKLKAKTVWGQSGNLLSIKLSDGTTVESKDFKKYHDDFIAEKYLLRDGK